MRLSVCICTLDHAELVADCVKAVLADAAGVDLEILIVNNGLSENVKSVAQDLAQRGVVRYELSPKRSLGLARNTALRCAQGDIVAYLDDDSLVETGWTQGVLNAFDKHPGLAAVTGPVSPLYEAGAPPWWAHPAAVASMLSCPDLGDDPLELRSGQAVIGCNMAFQKEALASMGGFHPALHSYYDEVWVCDALHQKKMSLMYWPEMRIRHRVTLARMSFVWPLKKARVAGAANAKLRRMQGWRFFRLGWAALGGMIRPAGALLLGGLTGDAKRTAAALLELQHRRGMLEECCYIRRHSGKR